MGATLSQFFPPAPSLTEANLPSQRGKVFIITGGASGIGFELASILYRASGKVYIAGRSKAKAEACISEIKSIPTQSPGSLVFLHLALDDLASIKPAVEAFTAAESRLDVLFNNAGVSNPPVGSVSSQGHELTMATNCLGHYLLAQLLAPVLVRTAKATSPAAVRVIWTSSIVVDLGAPKNGIVLAELETPSKTPVRNYNMTKVGNWFLASALASQLGPQGVLSITQNPGNLKTLILRNLGQIIPFLCAPFLYRAKMGAYTELWAGLSQNLRIENGGDYIVPWGRIHPSPRPDLLAALKSKEEGGTGTAARFVQFCERKTFEFR